MLISIKKAYLVNLCTFLPVPMPSSSTFLMSIAEMGSYIFMLALIILLLQDMMLHLMLAVIVFWEKIVYNSLTRKWPGNAWWPGGASAFTKALLPVHPQNNKNRKTTRN